MDILKRITVPKFINLRKIIWSALFLLLFSLLCFWLITKFSLLEEMKYVFFMGIYFMLLVNFIYVKKVKQLSWISIVLGAMLLLKLFCWDRLPADVEGAYRSHDFGCMCADGIYLFKDGTVTQYNLGHETKSVIGQYIIKEGKVLVNSKGENFEVYPTKGFLSFELEFGMGGIAKGYRVSVNVEKLKEYESFKMEKNHQ